MSHPSMAVMKLEVYHRVIERDLLVSFDVPHGDQKNTLDNAGVGIA